MLALYVPYSTMELPAVFKSFSLDKLPMLNLRDALLFVVAAALVSSGLSGRMLLL